MDSKALEGTPVGYREGHGGVTMTPQSPLASKLFPKLEDIPLCSLSVAVRVTALRRTLQAGDLRHA